MIFSLTLVYRVISGVLAAGLAEARPLRRRERDMVFCGAGNTIKRSMLLDTLFSIGMTHAQDWKHTNTHLLYSSQRSLQTS